MNRRVPFFLAIGIVLILIAQTGAKPQIRQAYAQSTGLVIGSDTSYTDNLGFLHVIGWIQNNSTSTFQFSKVTATFFDSLGTVAGTATGYADMSFLPAGQKSGFDVVFSDKVQASKVSKFSVSVDGETTVASRDAVLQIKQGEGYVDPLGLYHQTGQITNTGSATATFVKVYALEYDSSGKIIGHAMAYTSPANIQPGQSGTFDIIDTRGHGSAIKSVTLGSESDQYTTTTVVPEFPLPIIALVGGMAAIILIKIRMNASERMKSAGL